MKALTLTQPWASLVAIGAKRWETRSWGTKYRGPIAIHAAKALPLSFAGLHRHFETLGIQPAVAAGGRGENPIYDPRELGLPLGAVVATARLHVVISTNNQRFLHRALQEKGAPQEVYFGDYSPGRFVWILADVEQLPEPIPAKGSLGLWEWAA